MYFNCLVNFYFIVILAGNLQNAQGSYFVNVLRTFSVFHELKKIMIIQGSRRLEKYLNLEGFLENDICLEKY